MLGTNFHIGKINLSNSTTSLKAVLLQWWWTLCSFFVIENIKISVQRTSVHTSQVQQLTTYDQSYLTGTPTHSSHSHPLDYFEVNPRHHTILSLHTLYKIIKE